MNLIRWIVCQFKKHDWEPGYWTVGGVWIPLTCRRCGLRPKTKIGERIGRKMVRGIVRGIKRK